MSGPKVFRILAVCRKRGLLQLVTTYHPYDPRQNMGSDISFLSDWLAMCVLDDMFHDAVRTV
jgi:hypothetical protein